MKKSDCCDASDVRSHVKRKPPWGEQRGEEKTFETRPLVQCATATSVSFLFFYVRALDLRFSLWHSYLVNAVDTFNNLCLFSCLCTFSSAFVPVGQSLWPFLLLLLPGGNRFCISCLRCCALFSFFPRFCRSTLFDNTVLLPGNIPAPKGHFLFSCFVSMKWKWKLPFPLVFHFSLRSWQFFFFFFMLEYCTADQNTVIFLFFDDWSKCSI